MAPSRAAAIATCAALSLIGGGTYAFATNVLLNTPCNPICSLDTSFRKPWFAALCVLIVQAVASLIAAGILEVRGKPVSGTGAPPSGPPQLPPASVFDPNMRVPMTIISLLDAATVFLQSLASLYIPAAVNGAMRGTLLLITALMSRALRISDGQAGRLEWMGIAISTTGALGVGAVHIAGAAFPAATGVSTATTGLAMASAADAATGVFLSLLSNVTLAMGITWETKVFEKRKPSTYALNATRTSIGSVIMMVAMAIASVSPPARDHGYMENGSHTACCLFSTPAIAGFAFTIGSCATISGISALYLSALAGSNFRAVVYVGRALWVWLLELATFYAGSALFDRFAGVYGRSWNRLSYAMAFGFALVLMGGALTWRGRSNRMRERLLPLDEDAAEQPHEVDATVGEAIGGVGVVELPRSPSARAALARLADQGQAQGERGNIAGKLE